MTLESGSAPGLLQSRMVMVGGATKNLELSGAGLHISTGKCDPIPRRSRFTVDRIAESAALYECVAGTQPAGGTAHQPARD